MIKQPTGICSRSPHQDLTVPRCVQIVSMGINDPALPLLYGGKIVERIEVCKKKHQHSGILKGPTTALSHINPPNSLKLCHLTFLESCPWIWGDLSPEFSKRETVHSVVEQRVVAVVVLQIVNKVLQCCKCFQANDKIQHGILNEGYEKTGPKTKYQSALVYLSLFASTQVSQTYCPRITIAIVLIHRFLLTLPWQESSSIL